MKLLTELNESIQSICEEKEGKKNYFVEGIFLQSEIKNRNGRVYPKAILAREVARYNKDYIAEGRALGECGHPDSPTINLDRASHKFIAIKEDGNNFVGKAKILDTPMGKIVKNLMDEQVKLGMSSRGMGSLKPVNEGQYQLVQDDYYMATLGDIVADPSAPDAFVRGIMEGKEWIFDASSGNFKLLEDITDDIRRAKRKQLEEVALKNWQKFIEAIS